MTMNEIYSDLQSKNKYEFMELICQLWETVKDELKKALSDYEYKALETQATLYDWFTNPTKYEAIKNAMGEVLYNRFNGIDCIDNKGDIYEFKTGKPSKETIKIQIENAKKLMGIK